MENKEFITKTAQETKGLGIDFSQTLKRGDVIALYGDLGSGKTTFVQGLGEGLGVKRRIISPTFIIVRTYTTDNNTFYHIDLYRTESEEDLEGIGMREIVNGSNIVAIEWADKMGSLLPRKRIDIYFEYLNNAERKIRFIYHE